MCKIQSVFRQYYYIDELSIERLHEIYDELIDVYKIDVSVDIVGNCIYAKIWIGHGQLPHNTIIAFSTIYYQKGSKEYDMLLKIKGNGVKELDSANNNVLLLD